jgi:hypothetical protein
MPDVYLASDNVTVLGGPSSVNVSVDFGVQGERGSNFFVGYGVPGLSTTVIGQIPQIFDMYINVSSSDPKYLYLYQYQNVDGSYSWVELLKLITNTYNQNSTTTFTAGSATINIPVVAVVPPETVGSLSASNFSIQHSILGTSPIASSLSVGTLATISGVLSIPITISAAIFNGTTWSNLTGQKTVQLSITVV